MDLLDNTRAKPATNLSNCESAEPETQPIGGKASTNTNSQITNQSSSPSSLIQSSRAKDIKDNHSRPNVISRPINRIHSFVNSHGRYRNERRYLMINLENSINERRAFFQAREVKK